VAQRLIEEGYSNARAIEGGLDAWEDAGYRIEPEPVEVE
jgi:rhodanese-related sulfurtransferase